MMTGDSRMLGLKSSLLMAAVFAVITSASPAVAAEKLKVLIIDGQNNHTWQSMTPPMKAELEKTGRFTVEVATTPPANSSKDEWAKFRPDLSRYDVVLSNYNGELWPDEVQVGLAKFVGNGGGLVIIHAANNAFPQWGEWNRMIGLGWRGNDFGDRLTIGDDGKPVRTEKGQG